MRKALGFAMAALVAWAAGTSAASAQTLGTFSWQLTPYCNVITVTVTQNGGLYTLDGYDNQCGGSTRAAVLGMAVPNPTGTVTLGFAIVTPPSGTPVHVTTVIDLGSLGGSWSDDQGNSGTFVFTPSGVGSGAARPAAINGLADNTVTTAKIVDGAVGDADINAAEVQKRVSSTCPSGQLMTAVTESGGVTCEAVSSTSGGDITAVNAGSGLSGGGATGDVTLGIAAAGVTSSHLAPSAVDASKVLDGTIGAADINQAQVQTRVTGTCPAGQAMRTIAQTGAVTCEPITGGAGGDITGVAAGTGLTGGGTAGDVTLQANFAQIQARVAVGCTPGSMIRTINADGTIACEFDDNAGGDITGVTAGNGLTDGGQTGAVTLNVSFDGSGTTSTAARSDHTHAPGGNGNTTVGANTLLDTSGPGWNTVLGAFAVQHTTSGGENTAVGFSALRENTIGSRHTAVGRDALRESLGGIDNTAVGANSLEALTTGSVNLALGSGAGRSLELGSANVYIANNGLATESSTLRIGAAQNRAFISGIRGVTTGANNAQTVMIDSAGQLGTTSSSRKTKFDVANLDMSVSSALQRLRPVQFRYIKTFADGSTPIQYGLIAEEVQEVLPELVVLDDDGQPASVKYHVLPSLLLAEVQRLEREHAGLALTVDRLEQALAAMQTQLDAMAARDVRR